MEILWLAIVFYSVGLAALLHFRPALMFNENGTWKEFGYNRAPASRYTIFPVWLFAIAWAIVSYTAAAAIVWAWRLSPAATLGAVAMTRFTEPVEDEVFDEAIGSDAAGAADIDEDADFAGMMPVSAAPSQTETIRMRPSAKRIQTPARQPRMGYYVLDPASEKSGLRRYIYYGNAPPPDAQGASV
jgi:hypothetical protein